MPLTGTSVHGAKTSHLLSKHSESTGQLLSMWHLLHMGTSHQVWAVFVTESSRKHDEISGLGLRITSEHISAPPHQPNYLWQLPSKPEMMKRSLFMQKPSCARLGVSTRAIRQCLKGFKCFLLSYLNHQLQKCTCCITAAGARPLPRILDSKTLH